MVTGAMSSSGGFMPSELALPSLCACPLPNHAPKYSLLHLAPPAPGGQPTSAEGGAQGQVFHCSCVKCREKKGKGKVLSGC